MNKLSHSASNIFMDCPEKYRLHYQQRLRSKTQSAALFFGTAIDKAVGAMFINGDYKKVFEDTWMTQELNGKMIDLAGSTQIVYAESDYDEELIHDDAFQNLCNDYKLQDKLAVILSVNAIYDKKKEVGFEGLTLDEKSLLNEANWYCLLEKGKIMLECVKKHIMPNITEVLSLQEAIKLENSEKDAITGYVDIVCKWKDSPTPIIFDFKTATRQYDSDAVLKSPQLALYTHALSKKYNTNTAGFIVLHKTIKKNRTKICEKCSFDGSGTRHKTCSAELPTPGTKLKSIRCNGEWKETITPEATFQVLINEIPAQIQNLIVENMDVINESIKTGIFPRNLGSCIKNYGKCQFYNKCWLGSNEGLVKLDENTTNKK